MKAEEFVTFGKFYLLGFVQADVQLTGKKYRNSIISTRTKFLKKGKQTLVGIFANMPFKVS